ncbi:hypothetical protein [Nibricoccus sp. IMCC34717]|uniref:hypothetical protein n=1 Tax=Nibricoccus sp. IMCC34717 TaxID=3034021 RepID=UPI003850E4D4
MRKPLQRVNQARRAIWLLAVAALAGLGGVWAGRHYKQRAPVSTFAWVHEADRTGGEWRSLRKDGEAKAGKSETLEWVTPLAWETLPGPAKRTAAPARGEPELVLWLPLRELAKLGPVVDDPARVVVRSPLGVTRFQSPLLDWVAQPGFTYDVAVVDLEDEQSPPRLLTDTVPPVALKKLETSEPRPLRPGRLYQVQVRETGRNETLGVGRFLVAEEASDQPPVVSGPAAVSEALRAMHRRPFKTGDAWTYLRDRVNEMPGSELELRLRYVIALEQGDSATCDNLRRRLLN